MKKFLLLIVLCVPLIVLSMEKKELRSEKAENFDDLLSQNLSVGGFPVIAEKPYESLLYESSGARYYEAKRKEEQDKWQPLAIKKRLSMMLKKYNDLRNKQVLKYENQLENNRIEKEMKALYKNITDILEDKRTPVSFYDDVMAALYPSEVGTAKKQSVYLPSKGQRAQSPAELKESWEKAKKQGKEEKKKIIVQKLQALKERFDTIKKEFDVLQLSYPSSFKTEEDRKRFHALWGESQKIIKEKESLEEQFKAIQELEEQEKWRPEAIEKRLRKMLARYWNLKRREDTIELVETNEEELKKIREELTKVDDKMLVLVKNERTPTSIRLMFRNERFPHLKISQPTQSQSSDEQYEKTISQEPLKPLKTRKKVTSAQSVEEYEAQRAERERRREIELLKQKAIASVPEQLTEVELKLSPEKTVPRSKPLIQPISKKPQKAVQAQNKESLKKRLEELQLSLVQLMKTLIVQHI